MRGDPFPGFGERTAWWAGLLGKNSKRSARLPIAGSLKAAKSSIDELVERAGKNRAIDSIDRIYARARWSAT
jgi:hypothetical protein